MTPKLTPEMRDALNQGHGRPVDVEDADGSKFYVLIEKDAYLHLQGLQGQQEEQTREQLRHLIQEGVDSEGIPASEAFKRLRDTASKLFEQST